MRNTTCQTRKDEQHQKLVAMLRVKDGIIFIKDWLENMGSLVDEIVVVDNGSTDGTLEILKKHPNVVELRQTEGFHEGRDKILAYQLARSRNPDWVLWLDVDEIFERRLTKTILQKMMRKSGISAYRFRRYHFHRDYNHFEARFDKLTDISMPSRTIWREKPETYFLDRVIHNGDIQGITGTIKFSHYRLKHYGGVDISYLHRKTEGYLRVDPAHSDMYIRHRDQNLKVWKWYEWDENPNMVLFQNLILDTIYFFKLMSYYVSKIRQRICGY